MRRALQARRGSVERHDREAALSPDKSDSRHRCVVEVDSAPIHDSAFLRRAIARSDHDGSSNSAFWMTMDWRLKWVLSVDAWPNDARAQSPYSPPCRRRWLQQRSSDSFWQTLMSSRDEFINALLKGGRRLRSQSPLVELPFRKTRRHDFEGRSSSNDPTVVALVMQ